MKLNRNIWTSIAVALAVCILILAWQRRSISAMRELLSEMKSSTTLPQSRIGSKRLVSSSIPSGPEAQAGGESTGKRRLSIDELLAGVPSPETGFTGVKVLPQLLESFESYSAEELMAARNEMEELSKRDPSKAKLVSLVSPILTMIVSEIEPELVFKSIRDENDSGWLIAFTGLAKKDPARAAELLAASTSLPGQLLHARIILVREGAPTDLSPALAMIRENPADVDSMIEAVVSVATRDPVTREKLWGALANEGDQEVRQVLSEGLLTSVLISEGFEAAKDAFGRIEIADSEVKLRVVNELASSTMMSDPADAIGWIREVLPKDQAREVVATGIRSWTETDYKAVAYWLDEQPPSLERDYAIGAFAGTAAKLDPEAAVAWAMKIEVEVEQKRVLTESLRKWKEKDPAAAKAWMQQNEATIEPEMRFEPKVEERR